MEEVRQALTRLEQTLSLHLPDTEITRLNAQAGIGYVQLSQQTFDLLARAREACLLTEGRFNPMIAPLTLEWDIHRGDPHLPAPQRIEGLLPLVQIEDLLLREEDRVQLCCAVRDRLWILAPLPRVWPVMWCGRLLKRTASWSGYISIGGNINGSWRASGWEEFLFGVRDPRGGGNEILGTITLRDSTMSTSGDYERYFEQDGVRYHHILDPGTGYPAQTDLISVSVITPDGTLADYESTNLFILGRDGVLELLDTSDFLIIAVDRENRSISPVHSGISFSQT